ncbi:DUF2513 domain-containing protein [Weissella paramesenteroides]|uniref:DUF2513 domain-containing protein n=1 Tax=Weissella paramesenteroides TaxID=1249 RepID=UPI003F29641F
MKLELDNIRNILLDLEENLGYNQSFCNADLVERANKLGIAKEDYFYTIDRLSEANYVNVVYREPTYQPIVYVKSITYDGHQFLENIRNDKNWKKTKAVAKAAGNTSIKIISTIAEKVGAEIALNVLGLK